MRRPSDRVVHGWTRIVGQTGGQVRRLPSAERDADESRERERVGGSATGGRRARPVSNCLSDADEAHIPARPVAGEKRAKVKSSRVLPDQGIALEPRVGESARMRGQQTSSGTMTRS